MVAPATRRHRLRAQADMSSDDLRQLIEDVIAPVKLGVQDLQARIAGLVPRSEYDLRLKAVEDDIDDLKKRPAGMREWIFLGIAILSAAIAACSTLTTIAALLSSHWK